MVLLCLEPINIVILSCSAIPSIPRFTGNLRTALISMKPGAGKVQRKKDVDEGENCSFAYFVVGLRAEK